MKEILTILVSAILVENFVLSKFMGICPFLGVSKKLNSAVGMSFAVIFVMVISTAVTYPIYSLFLVPNDLTYLNTIVFILVIAAMVQLVDFILKRFLPSLHESLGVYLPLITTNCAVLGVTLLNVSSENIDTFFKALVNAVGAGDSMVAGFLAGWEERNDYAHAFRMAVAAGSASAFSELLATKEEIKKLYETLEP